MLRNRSNGLVRKDLRRFFSMVRKDFLHFDKKFMICNLNCEQVNENSMICNLSCEQVNESFMICYSSCEQTNYNSPV